MAGENEYWSVDAVGLDSEGAAVLAQQAGSLSSVLVARTVDPDLWLTRNLDRATVEGYLHAFRAALAAGIADSEARWTIQELVDDYQGWLDSTR